LRIGGNRILIATFLGFALRLAFLGRQSLWFDEAFSVVVASTSWKVFWSALVVDGVHPPGYYLLLRAALPLFGQTEFGVRFFSVVAGTLAVPLMWQVGHTFLGRDDASRLAMLLLALNPFALWYAQEARQYAWLLTLTCAGLWAYVRLLSHPSLKRWWLFTLITAFSFWIHYFALVFVLAQFVYLVSTLRRHSIALRWWAAAQGVAFLAFLPWTMTVATRQGHSFGIGWIQPVSLLDLVLTLSNLAFALSDPASIWTWLSLFVLVSLVAFGAHSWSSDYKTSSFLLSFLFTPILATFLISFRLPLYIDRFFIISLPPLLLMLASGARAASPRWVGPGATLLLVFLMAITSLRIFVDPTLTKEDWRAAAAYVGVREQPGDILAMRQLQDALPFGYYYQGILPFTIVTTNRQTTPLEDIIGGQERLWVVNRRPFASTHKLAGNEPWHWTDEPEPMVRVWYEKQADSLIEEKTFPGVYLLLYGLTDE
jgi:mannosyltransferase